MKTYTVNHPLTIQSGILQLTKEQAKPRMHNINALSNDTFLIINAVNFKAGEVFGYDGDLPKSVASLAEPVKVKLKPKVEHV